MLSPDATVRDVSPSTGRSATRSASLRVVADVDSAVWANEHARGLRPDASPYGLHRLAEHGFAVSADGPERTSGRLSRRIDGALRHRGAGFEWWAEARSRAPRERDVVVCWDERTGVPASLRSPRTPVATGVIWLTEAAVRRHWAALARRALARSPAVWALSSAQLRVLQHTWGVPASRLHHLRFGIDEQFWSPTSATGRADGPIVLSVGNDRHRDHDTLLRAVSGLPTRLTMVTGRPVTVPPAVGERIAELDHVALRARYERADLVAVLLRPNTHVSGVTTVLEAQAMGRPVVVSDTAGVRDYVRPGVTAELVPVGDVDAARRAIAGLLADPDRGASMGAAGREFVSTHATSRQMVAQLATILRAA